MKKILKEELNQIKYLFEYKKGVVISEQSGPNPADTTDEPKINDEKFKNYSVRDIQNKLTQIGYGDMLGKSGADGKFGKMTLSASTSVLSDFKTRKEKSANMAGATTIGGKSAAPLEVLRKEIKIDPPKSWCEQNTIEKEPYFERCFSMKGENQNDASEKLKTAMGYDFKEYKNKRDELWDDNEKFIYQVWSTATLDKKTEQNRPTVLASMKTGTQPQPSQTTA